jgi:membrane fusion protein, multidrug efflux system
MLRFRRLLEAGKVQSSRDVEITVGVGVADEEGFSRTGIINFVDNHLDPGTGTLRIRARVANPKLPRGAQHFLSPGMFVRIRLPIGPEHPATLVPEEALGTDQGQKVVYIVNAKDEVEQLHVAKLGSLNKGKRVIEAVIHAGRRSWMSAKWPSLASFAI